MIIKDSYLVKKTVNGIEKMCTATSKEWKEIVDGNKGLPEELKRHFIIDYIPEGTYIDRLVMETSYEKYLKWHREHSASERNREEGSNYLFLSTDMPVKDHVSKSYMTLGDMIFSPTNIEVEVEYKLLLEELREKLCLWKPWGCELLDLFMNGHRHDCSHYLMQKYNISEQTACKYKRQLDIFVRNFLAGV